VREVTREAYAKINVFLRVLGVRDDGYHDLESLVVPISLHDTVTCREAQRLNLSVVGGDPSLSDGPDNLVVVAALALAEASGSLDGAEIELEKRIPVAAGLGGGSADAAAVLSALNELWGCGLDQPKLQELAAKIGSDVPSTLAGRPVSVSGRGEHVTPTDVPEMWWVVVPAPFYIRTPDAFRWWDDDGGPTGPDPARLVAALADGDLPSAARLLFNDLERPVFARHREVAETKWRLLEAGAIAALMCGSGPTVAGLALSEVEAKDVASRFEGAHVANTRRRRP
jgi:4-diphosphocytidyl-2-C-methyl-D-erythritol kinase